MPGATNIASIPTYSAEGPVYVDNKDSSKKLQDNFFSMLTAQLQYQDPLKPMENAEFTNQMVGFYGLQEQKNSNILLEQLIKNQQVDGLNQGVSYLGQLLQVEGNTMAMTDGTGVVEFESDGPSMATISVFNEAGSLVKSLPAAQYGAGRHRQELVDPFLADGLYTFRVTPVSGGDVKITPLETGLVTGVVREEGVTRVKLNGHAVDLENIRQVDLGLIN